MSKLLRQNVGGTDYSMAGCALSATCVTAAATAAKVAELTDGDVLADGMSVTVQFTNGNTAASPLTLTVGGVTANICDSRGQNIGGNIWQAGNVVTLLYTFGKFLLLNCVVDEVTLNNMNSVSSNAVFNTISNSPLPGYWQDDSNKDPLTIVDTRFPTNGVSTKICFKMGHTNSVNTPYGDNVDSDFYYEAFRGVDNRWARMIAYDVRSNRMFMIAKIDNTWGKWSNYVNLQVDSAKLPSAYVTAARQLNVVQFSIDANSGSVGLAPNAATKIGTISPAPLLGVVNCIITMDLLSPTDNVYQRCWITNAGEIFLFHNQPNFANNVFITGTYICAV